MTAEKATYDRNRRSEGRSRRNEEERGERKGGFRDRKEGFREERKGGFRGDRKEGFRGDRKEGFHEDRERRNSFRNRDTENPRPKRPNTDDGRPKPGPRPQYMHDLRKKREELNED